MDCSMFGGCDNFVCHGVIFSGLVPARILEPESNVSGGIVFSWRPSQGTERIQLSSWTPPESVRISFAIDTSRRIFRYPTGLIIQIVSFESENSLTIFCFLGCTGKTTGILIDLTTLESVYNSRKMHCVINILDPVGSDEEISHVFKSKFLKRKYLFLSDPDYTAVVHQRMLPVRVIFSESIPSLSRFWREISVVVYAWSDTWSANPVDFFRPGEIVTL